MSCLTKPVYGHKNTVFFLSTTKEYILHRTMLQKTIISIISIALTSTAMALPIDWHGSFGVDSSRINTYRMTDSLGLNSGNDGDQRILDLGEGSAENASFQSYLLKLQPSLIVDDSVTINSEITTNYGRGGYLGDSSSKQGGDAASVAGTPSVGSNYGNALYFQNSTEGETLLVNKFYMELFADTATFVLGRYTKHWGLGALFNEGDEMWDRHVSIHDGVDIKFKIGSFYITPHWGKISTGATQLATDDVTDYGFSILYDNVEKDMAFGVLFSKRKSKQYAVDYAYSGDSGAALGITNVKIWDIYLKKIFGSYSVAVEVPFVSGDLGFVKEAQQQTNYKATAVILENSFEISERWTFGLDLGQVSGDSGGAGKFEAMYLHPNYQIAYLMFRYNLENISSGSGSMHDSYITNTRFLKFYGKYFAENWSLYGAFIYGMAMETAQGGGNLAFNHEKNRSFTSNLAQADDFGYELDFGFDYNWSANVVIGAQLGYFFVGDYYQFTNDVNTPAQKLSNSYLTSVKVSVNF